MYKTNKSIAVVVLTWNDWENTIKCLKSIFLNNYKFFDLILVDNNSNKFHRSKIQNWIKLNKKKIKINKIQKVQHNQVTKNKKFKNLFYIESNRKKKNRWALNLGCTAGLNLGYKFALKNKYDLIARVDCDFTLEKNYFHKMLSFMQLNNSIACSPRIMNAHESKKNTLVWFGFKKTWSYLKFQGTMNLNKRRVNKNQIKNENIKNTDCVCGCCSIYLSSALKKSGLGDEDFFFGPEDMELSFRLKKHGLLHVNHNVYAHHRVASSIKASGLTQRKYYETIGFLLLIKKIGTLSDKIFGYLFFLFRLPYQLIKKNYGYLLGCYDYFVKRIHG